MNDLPILTIMTIGIVLLILGLASAFRFLVRLWDLSLTFVNSLIITTAISIVATGLFLLSKNTEWPAGLAAAIVSILSLVLAFALALFVHSFFLPPRVESAIRRGWITVRPQILVRRKTNKAFVDHACALTAMNMPLAEGFFLAAHQTTGRMSIVLQAIATFLLHGLKLSEAYARYRARSALILSMLQVGERCGQLPNVLRYIQAHLSREQRYRRLGSPPWWPYPVTVMSVLLGIAAFVLVVIMPKYQQIFRDFAAAIPLPTQILIKLGDAIATNAEISWPVVILIALGAFIDILPRRYPRPLLHQRLEDRIAWRIPGLRQKHEYTDLAHAAAVLRVTLDSGMTLPDAVRCVADLDLNTVIRRRFEQLYDRLLRGESFDAAATQLRFPPRFIWALRPGQDRETLHASLELIERYYSLVASHWQLALNTILWPTIVTIMGIFVGFFVFAMFLPIVKLIESVTPW